MVDGPESLHRFVYAEGTPPLDWAETQIAMLITAREEVIASRAQRPWTFPLFGQDTSVEMISRRIIAVLLDAGWKMPEA